MDSKFRTQFMSRFLIVTFAATGLAACASQNPQSMWAQVDPPTVADETDDVTVDKGTLADGTYWATIAPVSGSSEVVFRTLKARFGDACYAWAKENGIEDGCLNDYHVEEWPDAHVALDTSAAVTVAQADGPGTSFSINAKTLRRLAFDESVDAPGNYAWTPFPFLVTVTNGKVTRAQQYWVP
jgi:hypothetical protein